jgi:hypothetical protein
MSDGLILELNEFILEGVIKFVEKHGVDVSKQLGFEIFEDTDSIWYGNLIDEAIKKMSLLQMFTEQQRQRLNEGLCPYDGIKLVKGKCEKCGSLF